MDPVTLKVMKPDLNPLFGHFENLYWIKFPLYIKDMVFDEEKRLVNIFVEYHKKATFPCSCGLEGLKIHDRILRQWRALDIGSFQTIIHLALPRIKCPKCGVKIIKVGWAREHSHFTYLMEERIVLLNQYMPLSNVARFLNVSEQRILNVLEHLTGIKPVKERVRASKKDLPPSSQETSKTPQPPIFKLKPVDDSNYNTNEEQSSPENPDTPDS
jgi:transposase